MLTPEESRKTNCIEEGPLLEAASHLLVVAQSLGNTRFAWMQRAWCLPTIHDAMMAMRDMESDPVPMICAMLQETAKTLEKSGSLTIHPALSEPISPTQGENDELLDQHYGVMWKELSTDTFWQQPYEQLLTRLERNEISPKMFAGKRILDGGCGSGRLAFVLKKLGASEVIGIDVSAFAIETAERYRAHLDMDAISFMKGSLLELPFDDQSFDVIFTMGVLHHTPDWKGGLTELIRVLKPEGEGLLMYLNERPGGLFWDLIEIMRALMIGADFDLVRESLAALGLSGDRIIHILDHVLVPVNERLTCEEIETALRSNRITEYRRFTRGCDRDRLEQVFQGKPFAEVKYGVGDQRYWFKKS